MKNLVIVLILVSGVGAPRYVQVGKDCVVYAQGSAHVERGHRCPQEDHR